MLRAAGASFAGALAGSGFWVWRWEKDASEVWVGGVLTVFELCCSGIESSECLSTEFMIFLRVIQI